MITKRSKSRRPIRSLPNVRQVASLPRGAAVGHRRPAQRRRWQLPRKPGEESGLLRQPEILLGEVDAALNENRFRRADSIAVGLRRAVIVAGAAGTAESDLPPSPAGGGKLADAATREGRIIMRYSGCGRDRGSDRSSHLHSLMAIGSEICRVEPPRARCPGRPDKGDGQWRVERAPPEGPAGRSACDEGRIVLAMRKPKVIHRCDGASRRSLDRASTGH